MTLNQLRDQLSHTPAAGLHVMLPDGEFVPAHFHVTEVGRVRKDFIDCGGTMRSLTTCLIQVWVATDTDHRLDTSKLSAILNLAAPLFESDDVPIEFEYEGTAVSQYPLSNIEVTPRGLLLVLAKKHTDCLAPDKCGVSGCC